MLGAFSNVKKSELYEAPSEEVKNLSNQKAVNNAGSNCIKVNQRQVSSYLSS